MLDIKREMAAVDRKDRDFYNNLTDEEKKQFSLFMMIRWASTLGSDSEISQYYLLSANERLNKNFFDIPKEHNQLQWLSVTTISPGMGNQRHEWLAAPKRKSANNKIEQFLSNLYPAMKHEDIVMMAELNDGKSLKQLAEDLGLTKEQIKKELG